MKRAILVIFLIFMGVACHNEVANEQPPSKMVPDHTPYIEGLIQYSPDTTFYYPEVLVGYFTDMNNKKSSNILYTKDLTPILHYPHLWSIMLTAQVVKTSMLLGLSWQPESHAVVKVRGPLGTPKETNVTFISEGNGVYGDKNYDLTRIANGKYKLQVTLPDGRKYVSKTYIPEYVPIEGLKDSVSTKVILWHYNKGAPAEKSPNWKGYPLLFKPPQNGFLSVFQGNSNRDRLIEALKPGDKFRYADYGPYLREGSAYTITLTRDDPQDTINLFWIQDLNEPDKVYNSKHCWERASFFSTGIGGQFSEPFIWFAGNIKFLNGFDKREENAADSNDTTFLHRVSTILKVGRNGKVLSKDSSDATGFFAGEFSRYVYTTLYPNRNFNVDSVITAWRDQNK